MQDVSVIIAAYNAERHIQSAIASALGQTRPPLEVIVVDDGSSDNTAEIANSLGSKIRLIKQSNRGVAAANNTGAQAAKGQWIAFLDADDEWRANKLERQLTEIGDRVISHTDSECFGDLVSNTVRRSSFEPQYGGFVLPKLLLRNFITKSSVLMRKSVFLDVGGFDESYRSVPDWQFWLRVCARFELDYVPEDLVRYRIHSNTISMRARRTVQAHERIIAEAFAPGGVGASMPELRKPALISSYEINSHFAAESGDWRFAAQCALKALLMAPRHVRAWKTLGRSLLMPLGSRQSST